MNRGKVKKSIFSKKLLVSFGSLVTLAAIPLIAIRNKYRKRFK
ncbi:variable surface lipoprotein [Mesomycoplasma hyorhinis]